MKVIVFRFSAATQHENEKSRNRVTEMCNYCVGRVINFHNPIDILVVCLCGFETKREARIVRREIHLRIGGRGEFIRFSEPAKLCL